MNKVIIILLLALFFVSGKDNTEIKSIHVLYCNYIYIGETDRDCNGLKKRIPTMKRDIIYDQKGDSVGVLIDDHGVLDSTLTDPILLKKIKVEIDKLKEDTSIIYPVDARISCVITYWGGREEKICIGGRMASGIYYNGQPQKRNNRLLFLIKKNIGYYYWIDKRYLSGEGELNDRSIKRDSIVNKYGEKY